MKDVDKAALDQIIDSFASDRGAAMMILQKVQATFGYVSPEIIDYISQVTGTPASDLFGIATFYAQFRLEPLGENIIQVCHGTACHLAGAEQISEAVINEAGVQPGGTSADGKFTLEHVACLGCCSHGPVITLNGTTHARMSPEKVKKLVKEARKGSKCPSKEQSTPAKGKGCDADA